MQRDKERVNLALRDVKHTLPEIGSAVQVPVAKADEDFVACV